MTSKHLVQNVECSFIHATWCGRFLTGWAVASGQCREGGCRLVCAAEFLEMILLFCPPSPSSVRFHRCDSANA